MAPTHSLGDILQARSAPLPTTPLAVPIVIALSSAAGISSLIVIAFLAIALYRRNRFSISRKSNATPVVPRLTITDTSRFPASTLIVASETTLDGVIASFRPLGTEPDVVEEALAIDVHQGYDDDRDLFPLPKPSKLKDKFAHLELDPAHSVSVLETIDEQFELGPQVDGTLALSPAADSGYALTTEGVWWHDFRAETESMTDTQSSIYSITSESDMPTTPDCPRISNRTTNVIQETANQKGPNVPSSYTSTEENMQNALYDADVLAYCWRLSEGDYGLKSSRSSSLGADADVRDVDAMLDHAPSEVDIADSYIMGDTLDSQILEFCWRISDTTPSKNTDCMSGSDSTTIRYTKAARLVSNASVAVLSRRLHDSGHLVFPWDSSPSDGCSGLTDQTIELRSQPIALRTSESMEVYF